MKFKKKLLNYLMKKISTNYWCFIDNLSYRLDKLADIYYKRSIGPEYKREYEVFGISENDRILHIGSGSFPLTEITLAEEIGANVVGVDKNLRAVKSANSVIQKKKLNDKIKIEYGNGMDYPVGEFDVIIISSCSSPMIEIVKHVFKTAKKNSKIIVREMETSIKPLIEWFDLQSDITIVKKLDHHPFPFLKPFGWNSICLTKNQ